MRHLGAVLVLCAFLFVMAAKSQAPQQPNVAAAALQAPGPNAEPDEPQGPGRRMRGYSDADARTERDWDSKFRALPEPGRARDYMQRLSARP
ncbi:MAG: hypothetical protein WCC59_02640, partial [Terriglobales bacterium]